MSVRIEVDIPAGQIEVVRAVHATITDSGTENLATTLRDAANAVLRSYGLPASITTNTSRERLIEEANRATPRGGW